MNLIPDCLLVERSSLLTKNSRVAMNINNIKNIKNSSREQIKNKGVKRISTPSVHKYMIMYNSEYTRCLSNGTCRGAGTTVPIILGKRSTVTDLRRQHARRPSGPANLP